MLHKKLFLDFKLIEMIQEKTLLIPAAGKPQIIAFSMSEDTGTIIPWLLINEEWVRQAGFKIGDHIEIDVKNNRLVIKKLSADGDHRN